MQKSRSAFAFSRIGPKNSVTGLRTIIGDSIGPIIAMPLSSPSLVIAGTQEVASAIWTVASFFGAAEAESAAHSAERTSSFFIIAFLSSLFANR